MVRVKLICNFSSELCNYTAHVQEQHAIIKFFFVDTAEEMEEELVELLDPSIFKLF